MTLPAQSSVATIDQFLQTVGAVKSAEAPLSEPGSKGGETKHPVKSVDDRLQDAKEGPRSAENSKDVKEDQGPPSIEKAPEAKAAADAARAASLFNVAGQFALGKKAEGGAASSPGSAADDQVQIGPNKQPTGEDPSNETSSAKAGKEDPGSKHPMRTDNDSIDGHKWAVDGNMPLEKLASVMKECGDHLCASISNLNKAASDPVRQPQRPQQNQPKQAHDIDPALAQQAGWEMAGLMTGNFDKRAADSLVRKTLVEIIKRASDDADNYIEAMDSFRKQAEGTPPPEMPPPGPPGGGAPPPGGGDDGGAGMLDALGGGAPAGDAGGGMGGGMGGGGDAEAMQLAQILEHLNISPEELEQAMAEMHGGGGGGDMGGMGGGAGGPPPGGGGAGGPPPGMEAQASDRGRAAPTPQQIKSAEIHNYISELVSRSRAKHGRK
jgi:hypothetical protein